MTITQRSGRQFASRRAWLVRAPGLLLPLVLMLPVSSMAQQEARSETDASCGQATVLHPDARISRTALCELLRESILTHSDAVFVSRGDTALLTWASSDPPPKVHVMSVTKSVVGLALGRLLRDSILTSLDTTVASFYPEWRQGRKKDITLWHVLTHTSGIQDVPNAGLEIEPAPDAVQLALAAELETSPGSEFKYNNKATNLLAGIVERITGAPLDRYLGATVFHDLDITDFEWIKDPAGHPYGMAGLVIGARDLAKVGRLLMDGGRWRHQTIIDPGYALEAVRAQHTLFPRHGLLWWLMTDEESGEVEGFYGDGWLGQWLVVIPDRRLVAVRLINRASWSGEEDSFEAFRDRVRNLDRPADSSRQPPQLLEVRR